MEIIKAFFFFRSFQLYCVVLVICFVFLDEQKRNGKRRYSRTPRQSLNAQTLWKGECPMFWSKSYLPFLALRKGRTHVVSPPSTEERKEENFET